MYIIYMKINCSHTLPILVIKNLSGLSLVTTTVSLCILPAPGWPPDPYGNDPAMKAYSSGSWSIGLHQVKQNQNPASLVDLEIYQITSLDQPSPCRYVKCKYFILWFIWGVL